MEIANDSNPTVLRMMQYISAIGRCREAATREPDCARGLLKAAEHYSACIAVLADKLTMEQVSGMQARNLSLEMKA